MKILVTLLLLAQLAFDVYAIDRMSGIEEYLANDWKGSNLEERMTDMEITLSAARYIIYDFNRKEQ